MKPLDAYSDPLQLYPEYGYVLSAIARRILAYGSIDGTVLKHNGESYYVWSCLRVLPGTNQPDQSLCISRLLTPTKIDQSNIGIISQPIEPWERHGRPLNEGPQPLYWAGET